MGEALDTGQFYGREKELTDLKRWIGDERCRMVEVLGIGGIGKSSLIRTLVKEMSESFDFVFWRSLYNAPPLHILLQDCIKCVSAQRVIKLPENIDEQLSLLIQYLREQRCLLVLDNVEPLLQGSTSRHTGQFVEGYEAYGKLLHCIGQTQHQSCLLLTSREKLKEVEDLERTAAPIRTLSLVGLEVLAGQDILKNKGLSGTNDTLADLVHLYSGNPLALKMVAKPIQDLFQGDITVFLKEDTAVVRSIYDLLDKQFHRLSVAEQDIMYWLAIEREPVSLDTLQEDSVHLISKREVLAALQSLQPRSMIETSGIASFTLQPVIMEYVIESFVERVCQKLASSTIGLFGSHALMKAQSKDYIRDSQIRLILMSVARRLRSRLGAEGLEQKCKSILSRLRAKQPQYSSYGAGNVLNLLIQSKYDLQGFDFSHLEIWQVYLQEVSLLGVNFAHAHFAKSVFIDTFGGILSVAFSSDGRLLAAGTANDEVRLWDAASGTPINTYRGHTDWVRSVTFNHDDTMLATGSEDYTVRIWDISSGQCLKILTGHAETVSSVAFSLDGSILASGGQDNTIKLWNTRIGKCLKTFHGHKSFIWSVAFSPDGSSLASGSEDKTIRLWDVSSGQCLRTMIGHTGIIWSVAFSPDGNIIGSGSQDSTVRLWDANSGECLKTLQGHTGKIRSVAFHPHGLTIVSGSEDGMIKIWNIRTGECLKTLRSDRPYEHMNITGVKGLTMAQKATLRALGAIEEEILNVR